MRRRAKADFLTGLVAVLPLAVTILILWFLVVRVGHFLGVLFQRIPYLSKLPSPAVSLLGFLVTLFLIYLVGTLTRTLLGRLALRLVDRIITKVPLARTIYSSTQKLSQTVFLDRSAFRRVVLVEWPRKGTYTLAFVTSEATWEIGGRKKAVNLFIPTVPNPTTGFYVIMPEDQLIPTELTVEEGFASVISAGIVLPQNRRTYAKKKGKTEEASSTGYGEEGKSRERRGTEGAN